MDCVAGGSWRAGRGWRGLRDCEWTGHRKTRKRFVSLPGAGKPGNGTTDVEAEAAAAVAVAVAAHTAAAFLAAGGRLACQISIRTQQSVCRAGEGPAGDPWLEERVASAHTLSHNVISVSRYCSTSLEKHNLLLSAGECRRIPRPGHVSAQCPAVASRLVTLSTRFGRVPRWWRHRAQTTVARELSVNYISGQRSTYFAWSVGPKASRAKLLGKSGFPGPRSPTPLYGTSQSLGSNPDMEVGLERR